MSVTQPPARVGSLRALAPVLLTFGMLLMATPAGAAPAASGAASSAASAHGVSQLFVHKSAQLTPAGKRWLAGQVTKAAKRPDRLVVVSFGGADSLLKRERVKAIRAHLQGLGVAPERVVVENLRSG